MESPKGTLYLLPNVLAPDTLAQVLPAYNREIIGQLKYFLAENPRNARRFLSGLELETEIRALHIAQLDKETPEDALPALLAPLLAGESMGLLSDSGCPGIADPGQGAVAWAHEQGVVVVPLVGPSSLLLALMASGLNGQSFAFQGYLPVPETERASKIKHLEKISRQYQQTQLFIETPYRNQSLMMSLLKNCQPDTRLCLAYHLTAPEAWVKTHTIRDWQK
ncbi:MAG: SAM-dependent methyltransferase [Microscillaceae bacterium]|nr:SAM-dependent methyltransferase [Microscillaceae bacterium]